MTGCLAETTLSRKSLFWLLVHRVSPHGWQNLLGTAHFISRVEGKPPGSVYPQGLTFLTQVPLLLGFQNLSQTPPPSKHSNGASVGERSYSKHITLKRTVYSKFTSEDRPIQKVL